MKSIRRSSERGGADHGWLKTKHSFSFAGYYDPDQMGFRALRVMNEDRVAPGQGFGTHSHDNMEIISYVLSGSLEHKDSMGNGEVLKPGEFQRISAGSGIMHSEFNPSSSDEVHFYQIWITPDKRNTEPGYQQKEYPLEDKLGRLLLVASPSGKDGSLSIHQDAEIYLSVSDGREVRHELKPGRHAWLQVLSGAIIVNGTELWTSDGIAISEERELVISGQSDSEFMLFDLA
jgi:quercetin 2,3-dioxygenase